MSIALRLELYFVSVNTTINTIVPCFPQFASRSLTFYIFIKEGDRALHRHAKVVREIVIVALVSVEEADAIC
jgi:hypothetical protein